MLSRFDCAIHLANQKSITIFSDVFTGTYGRPGADEGFRLDPGRSRAVVTARRTGTEEITYADDIYHLEFGDEPQGLQVGCEAVSGKGCNIPVALSATELVYHHRSPTESGDLWRTALMGSDRKGARLTQTMPLSLQRKLLTPTEVTIRNDQAPRCDGALPVHAQVFSPEGDGPLQPLLWVHGGPMAPSTSTPCSAGSRAAATTSWLRTSQAPPATDSGS